MGLKKPSSSCGRIRLRALVAIVCVAAVGCAIGWAVAAVDALKQAARSDSPELRAAAAKALQQIHP